MTETIIAGDLAPGDFLWRTPAQDSLVVAEVTHRVTTVEVRSLTGERCWFTADAPVRVAR